ncbi:type 1 glutamine amidotransferase domain-containing protein [Pseudalkalibacillus salsuginis]|uniref:type 1 glutamine amidotransferase domain-containing protein n=1 Tax=Pseudalkalibacillus salsuginis TaxID=2910972 RepID=UPI001F162E42|nr:type 1 glutamine amidotransferase domain-containing protein [Pseudalkalibacillus salsuginis]MCF6411052.1 type 1 glutamine amidotransferase [Pseudalkalibacillus salsuginis]
MSKIAVLMTDMFEDVEYTDPAQAFIDEGHELTIISTEKKEVEGKQGDVSIQVDETIDKVSPEDFDALFIPGGFSPDILRGDDRIVEFAGKMVYLQKPVFAICHGPQILITANVLNGRSVTGFKSIQLDLQHAGANVFDEPVVVCGNLVTSRQPDDIPQFIEQSKKVLNQGVKAHV